MLRYEQNLLTVFVTLFYLTTAKSKRRVIVFAVYVCMWRLSAYSTYFNERSVDRFIISPGGFKFYKFYLKFYEVGF